MKKSNMTCRLGCGACCIAPSISTPLPGMPNGKPAGVRCIQLDNNNLCRLFGLPNRPLVCAQFKPEQSICGGNNKTALETLIALENLTS